MTCSRNPGIKQPFAAWRTISLRARLLCPAARRADAIDERHVRAKRSWGYKPDWTRPNLLGADRRSALFSPDSAETVLEVVDSSGRVWPITAESYEVSSYDLEMIFDQPLPAGSYRLISSPTAGITDLAGQPIFGAADAGRALASWTVVPQALHQAANDLGILWPSSVNATSPNLSGPFEETTVLAPGQGMDYRWSVIVPGFYKLQTELQGGPVAVFNNWDGLTTVLDPGSSNGLNNYLMNLNNGVYTIRFVNESSKPVSIEWVLKIRSSTGKRSSTTASGKPPRSPWASLRPLLRIPEVAPRRAFQVFRQFSHPGQRPLSRVQQGQSRRAFS